MSYIMHDCFFRAVFVGNQRRSFKYNHDSTKSRRLWSSEYTDSYTEDTCLAKNLLRSPISDDDDYDAIATGRLRPPTMRDSQPSACPCAAAATSTSWRISGAALAAAPSTDCPFCWTQLPLAENCGVDECPSSHRWSTPGIRISSSESPTSAACIHAVCEDDVDPAVAKRRCASLNADLDAGPSASLRRSVPDIARSSLRGRHAPPPTSPSPSSTGEKWLSAGIASLSRPTTVPRVGVLPACLRCPVASDKIVGR